MTRRWRVADSLIVLRNQINAAYPKRNKGSDGTIGDAAHASRSSDHNPWYVKNGVGVVTALDITHDPANGVDIDKLTDLLVGDDRLKYEIANALIWDRDLKRWVPYHGSNPHRKHMHVSVNTWNCDSRALWKINAKPVHAKAKPAVTKLHSPTATQSLRRWRPADNYVSTLRLTRAMTWAELHGAYYLDPVGGMTPERLVDHAWRLRHANGPETGPGRGDRPAAGTVIRIPPRLGY